MGRYPLYDESGNFKEHMEFDESVFGTDVNVPLIRASVIRYEANRRQGNACTKERSEIKGSMKKPWRQKGLGRARAGSRKSPIWKGGGTTFGPKPRSFRRKLNRKARHAATRSALLSKFSDREVLLIEKLAFPEPKTADAARILKNIGVRDRVLVGLPDLDPVVWKSFRNIQNVFVVPAADINAYDLVRQKKVVFTLGALEKLQEKYGVSEKKGDGQK